MAESIADKFLAYKNQQTAEQPQPQAQLPASSAQAMPQQTEAVGMPASGSGGGAPQFGGPSAADRFADYKTQQALETSDVNKYTGAPASVRLAVGSVETPQDKLAALRQSYPDAQRYGDDDFVFRHPETGEVTQVNPKGFDFGDLAGAAPEIGEFLGGVAGGALGSMASPVGTVLGTGAGAAAGRGLVQKAAQYFTGADDTRSTGEQAADIAVTGGLNAVGAKVAPYIGKGLGYLTKPVTSRFTKQAPDALIGDYAKLGVTPSAGVSGNRFVQTSEQVLGNTPGGAPIMQEAIERQQGQLQTAARNVAQSTGGTAQSKEQLGKQIKTGVGTRMQQLKNKAESMYNKANMAPSASGIALRDNAMSLNNLAKLRNEWAAEIAAAPTSAPPHTKALVKEIDGILTDSMQPAGYKFASARKKIADFDERAKAAPAMGNVSQAEQKRIAAAMRADLDDTAAAAGGDADKLYRRANSFWKNKVVPDKAFRNDILDETSGERIYDSIFKGKPNFELVRKARRNTSKKEWNNVVATVAERMGLAKSNQQGVDVDIFSPNTFMTNFANLKKESPEAFRELFGGARQKELREGLERLARASSSIKESSKTANPSGTARHLAYMGLLGAGGAALTAGDPGGMAATFMAGIVAPKYAAKLMTNPKFVNWLTKTPAQKSDKALARHLAALYMISQQNPDIREEVQLFLQSAQKLTP